MDDHRLRQWFLDPQQPQQRRYEILRGFFVDRQPMADLARRFDLTHGAVRNLVSQFRDRKSTRLNSSHIQKSRMPSSA